MVTEAEIQYQAGLSSRHTELTKFADKHLCAECGGILVVRWTGQNYEMSCGQNKVHTGAKSCWDTPAQIERRAKQMVVDKVGTEKGIGLAPYTVQAALTKVEAEYVLRTIWPKAPEAEIIKAALICQDYGLNPLMKHLFLVRYNEGKPTETWAVILSIHANRLLARRRGVYSYVDDTPRIMSEAEQKRRFGEVDTKNYWAITRLIDTSGNEAPGYGNWPKDKAVYGADKGNTPQKMAFIRSERDALDRLCPGELPALEVAEAEFMEAPRIINGKTGEIKVLPPSPPQGEERNPPIQPASLDYLARPYPPGSEPNLGKTQSPEPVKVSVERPKTAPTLPATRISQERIDQLSRDLTAIGYLPAKREALFASQKFQAAYPGIKQLRELSAEQADRFGEWITRMAGFRATRGEKLTELLWEDSPTSDGAD